jgi:hypothetical protein
MKLILTAAAASLLTVLPFVALELRNASGSRGFVHLPYPLFAMLWLLPFAFILAAAPIVRIIRAGNSLLAHPGAVLTRVAMLGLVAFLWASLVQDQMPCFLGVPNCD